MITGERTISVPRIRPAGALSHLFDAAVSGLVVSTFGALAILSSRRFQQLLLIAVLLDLSLQIDITLAYQEDAARLGAIGGFNVSLTSVAVVLLYGSWFLRRVSRAEAMPAPRLRKNVPLLFYVAFAALSFVFARDHQLASFELFLLAQMVLLHLFLLNWIRDRKDLRFIVATLLVGLAIQSALILGSFLGLGITIPGISTALNDTSQFARSMGTFGSPNSAGMYLTFLLPLAAVVATTRRAGSIQWIAAAGFVLGLPALITTFSRGAWAAFVLSLAMLLMIGWPKGNSSRKLAILVLALVGIITSLMVAPIMERLTTDDEGAAHSRVPLMILAARVIADNPVFGVGANNFTAVIDRYLSPQEVGEWIYTVHNKYLLVWAETGLGGLCAFLWLLVSTCRQALEVWRVRAGVLSSLALGLLASVTGAMFFMLVDMAHDRVQAQALFCIIALTQATHSLARD